MTQEFSKSLGEGGREQTIHDVSVVSSQNVTFNQTQIIQISVEEVKTRKFIITSPYKGLKKFESEDKDRFFGRDQFLTGLVNELEQNNFVLLLGASGSGKSSVIRAGLIPWLAERQGSHFMNLVFTPDQDPFESLYASLLGKYKQSEAQIARITKEDTLTQLVRSLKQKDAYWFILIDQFEELFTTTESSKRDVFIKSLVQLVKTLDKAGDRSVKLVATMRADFLDRLSPYPDLIKITDKHRPMIAEMQLDELRLAIEQPAAHHGVVFETGLVKQIIDDVQGQAGYLPLLQYTLDLLWETEVQSQSIADRTLNISNYRKLGGVRGALQQHVDQIYKSLSESEKLAAQRIFLKLVGIGEDEESGTEWKPVRRRATRSEFSDPLEQTVLTQLVNQNLLVSNRVADSQESTIEIAHEALLTSWVTLNTWIKENRQAIALRNRLNDDVEQWKKTKSNEDLWSGSKLEQILELRRDETFNNILGGLNQEANNFVDISQGERDRIQKERVRLQRRAIQWLSGGLILALAAASVATFQWYRVERLNQEVFAHQLASQSKVLLGQRSGKSNIKGALLAVESYKHFNQLKEQSPDVNAILSQGLDILPRLLLKHDASISTLSLSREGTIVATSGEEGTIWLWNTIDGRLIDHFQNNAPVSQIRFSPVSNIVATASKDGTVRLWDITHKKQIALFSHNSSVLYIVFSHNGKSIATASKDGTVRLWDIKTQKILTHFIDNKSISSLDISQNGMLIATGSGDNLARVWDVRTGKILVQLRHGHENLNNIGGLRVGTGTREITGVTSVKFSSDGNMLVTGCIDGSARIWNIKTGKQVRYLNHEDIVTAIELSADGKTIVTGELGGAIRLWNFLTGKEINRFDQEDPLVDMAFNSNSMTLITAYGNDVASVWNINKGRKNIQIGYRKSITAAAFNSDASRVVTGGQNIVQVWDTTTGKEITRFPHNGRISDIAFSPTDNSIITGSVDNDVVFWSINSRGIYEQKFLLGVYASKVKLSHDGSLLITIGNVNRIESNENPADVFDSKIQVWNVKTHKRIANFNYKNDLHLSVDIGPHNNQIAIAEDNVVKIWDITTQTEVTHFNGNGKVSVLAYSPDGTKLAIGSGNVIRILNIKSGKEISQFNHSSDINVVEFIPNTNIIATATEDGTLQFSDIKLQREIFYVNHNDTVYGIKFNSDKSMYYTISRDGLINVTPIQSSEELERQICNRLQHNLSATDWISYLGSELTQYQLTCPKIAPDLSVIEQVLNKYKPDNAIRIVFNLVQNQWVAKDNDKKDYYLGLANWMPSKGYIESAISFFRDLAKKEDIPSEYWNNLCWFGSLYNQPSQVMFACNKAVELAPNDPETKDSRGTARALVGDKHGAIQDFSTYLNWDKASDIKKTRRKEWIKKLEAGENPLTNEVLVKLREEESL